jgi:hypothetical protein
MPPLKVNDIELYYESHGTGDPLVLIGGLALAREMHVAIPSSRLALRSGGHFIELLLPYRQQQFVATVLGFLPPSKPPSAA